LQKIDKKTITKILNSTWVDVIMIKINKPRKTGRKHAIKILV